MSVYDILSAVCLIGSCVCIVVALVLGVSAEIMARKLRKEIQEELDKRKAGE